MLCQALLDGAYCFDLSFPPGQSAIGYSTVLTLVRANPGRS
jgi:hypothetical protein